MEGSDDFFAHTLGNCPPRDWQGLREHLENVAGLAEGFGRPIGAPEWARIAGLWHDLGKYSRAFQDYLEKASSPDSHVADSAPRTDHSTAGAQHAASQIDVLGHLIAYVVAGHHSGLLDGINDGACLDARLKKTVEPYYDAPDALLEPPDLTLPSFLKKALDNNQRDPYSISFFTRMLFSCLVDADFLDTERFMDPARASQRPSWPTDTLQRMSTALDAYIDQMQPQPNVVNQQRALVREACLKAARLPPGLFSLTVPTGGGKTLSSLAFALRHAIGHGLHRVVFVVPFTTIIEQNADRFRAALEILRGDGFDDPIIEHHSNIDTGQETLSSRLAAENWDAPLVVTTSVQFYESLFANKTSRCRKLHNLAEAVVILDEVQTLPVDYLEPCLRALEQLSLNYGASVVLCTATQPAIHQREGFPIGLSGVREIIPEPKQLYEGLRRVEIEDIGSQEDEALVKRLLEHGQVLCIVNTRGHARQLFAMLGKDEGQFHLSALMCPAHRSEILGTIHGRLERDETCRVISTQLIEAGVDIDFPVVFRSLAGLDSIAQAAGRCNRNGSLQKGGLTFVFRSEHARSERFFADTANSTKSILPLHDDPLSLEAIEHYFRLYYWDQSSRWDTKHILKEFCLNQDPALPFLFGFETVGRNFRLIETTGKPVIIPWRDRGEKLCEELRSPWKPPDMCLLRRLQRYTVQIPQRIWDNEVGRTIELAHERYPVLISPETSYSERIGLSFDEDLSTSLVV